MICGVQVPGLKWGQGPDSHGLDNVVNTPLFVEQVAASDARQEQSSLREDAYSFDLESDWLRWNGPDGVESITNWEILGDYQRYVWLVQAVRQSRRGGQTLISKLLPDFPYGGTCCRVGPQHDPQWNLAARARFNAGVRPD